MACFGNCDTHIHTLTLTRTKPTAHNGKTQEKYESFGNRNEKMSTNGNGEWA